MVKKKITIKNKLGLHARAAVKFMNLANRFVSSVRIEKDGNEIDGKSILGMQFRDLKSLLEFQERMKSRLSTLWLLSSKRNFMRENR